jgi:hypothetical protein
MHSFILARRTPHEAQHPLAIQGCILTHIDTTLYVGGIPAAVAALLFCHRFLLHDAPLRVSGNSSLAIWIAVFWVMGALKSLCEIGVVTDGVGSNA